MTIGDMIVKYREEHDVSQRKFAYMCGLSNGYISMIEKNLNPQTGKPPVISPDNMRAIARAMGMSMTDLARSVDPDTKIYLRVDPTEGIGEISTPIHLSSNPDIDTDEKIDIMLEGMLKLSQDDRKKLLNMARVMFPCTFPDEEP